MFPVDETLIKDGSIFGFDEMLLNLKQKMLLENLMSIYVQSNKIRCFRFDKNHFIYI